MIAALVLSMLAAECPRTPAQKTAEASRRLSADEHADVEAMKRAVAVAYPGYQLVVGDQELYVTIDRITYQAEAKFDRDEKTGWSALVFSLASQQQAAVDAGGKLSPDVCRAPVELVLLRERGSNAPAVIARAQLDEEAVSVDIRTMQLDVEADGPTVNFLYFAYYRDANWFGFVGFNTGMWIDNGKLDGARLPRSYLKITNPDRQRMEGYLAPAGGDPDRGIARLQVAAFGSAGEVNREIEVPLIAKKWLSGSQILRRVP